MSNSIYGFESRRVSCGARTKLLKGIYTYRSIGDYVNRGKKISLNVNEDLWHKFRIRCMERKKTATEVLEEFIANYVKK